MSPALADGFLTTESPGKSWWVLFKVICLGQYLFWLGGLGWVSVGIFILGRLFYLGKLDHVSAVMIGKGESFLCHRIDVLRALHEGKKTDILTRKLGHINLCITDVQTRTIMSTV